MWLPEGTGWGVRAVSRVVFLTHAYITSNHNRGLEAGDVARLAECLPPTQKAPGVSLGFAQKPGMVPHTCNLSTGR